jgi:hypothetical protein
MSSLDVRTSFQFTSPHTLRQGTPPAPMSSLRFQYLFVNIGARARLRRQDNTCAWRGHLLTVEMLPDPAWDGPDS